MFDSLVLNEFRKALSELADEYGVTIEELVAELNSILLEDIMCK